MQSLIAVGPSWASFEVAMYHLQPYIVSAACPESVSALRCVGAHVYTLVAKATGRVVHWFLPRSARIQDQVGLLSAQGYEPIVFGSFLGGGGNVQAFLENWLGRTLVSQINDARFLAISRVLVGQGSLAGAIEASLQTYEEERLRCQCQRGPMPLEWRKRLRVDACQKAQPGQPACVVCRENVASVVFLDCCHVIACENCVQQNWENAPSGAAAASCFECRTPWRLGPGSIYLAPAL